MNLEMNKNADESFDMYNSDILLYFYVAQPRLHESTHKQRWVDNLFCAIPFKDIQSIR